MILTERVNNRTKIASIIFLFTKPLPASTETPSLWLKIIVTERVMFSTEVQLQQQLWFTKPLSASAKTPSFHLEMLKAETLSFARNDIDREGQR